MRFTTVVAATTCLFGGLIGGCQADPSYRLRWEIETWPQPGPRLAVTAATICSKAGIFDVRARTFDLLGQLVDERGFACYAEGFGDPTTVVDGPALPPGEYLIELRGLTRSAQGFVVPVLDGPDLGGLPGDGESDGSEIDDPRAPACTFDAPTCSSAIACDCKVITVEEEVTVAVTDFVIDQPPQCIDGIDNDRDGAVDRQDPACAGGLVDDAEDADVERTTLNVQFSFFDHNPNVTCNSIGIDGMAEEILVAVDGITRIREPCSLAPIRRSLLLETGAHEVSASLAIGSNEQAVVPVVQAFEVRPGLGAVVDLQVDFGAEAFTPPIEREISLTANFRASEAVGTGSYCAGAVGAGANFEIATLRVGIADGHGGPISPVVLRAPTAGNGEDVVIPSGGTVDVDCFASVRSTEPLLWGDYIVSVEALTAQGEVCFANGGERAAPRAAFSDPLPRVFPVPPSCRECDPGACPGSYVCNAGVCVTPCATDQDCDTGEACVDTLCVEAPEPE